MKKNIIICDHCGKELNGIEDYIGIEFDNMVEWFTADLCKECYMEISNKINQFCNK